MLIDNFPIKYIYYIHKDLFMFSKPTMKYSASHLLEQK